MSIDEYWESMGVKHNKKCEVCDEISSNLYDKRAQSKGKSYKGKAIMGRIHSLLKPFSARLSRVWEKEHTPLVLAIILALAVYIVLTTRLIEYIVGGL